MKKDIEFTKPLDSTAVFEAIHFQCILGIQSALQGNQVPKLDFINSILWNFSEFQRLSKNLIAPTHLDQLKSFPGNIMAAVNHSLYKYFEQKGVLGKMFQRDPLVEIGETTTPKFNEPRPKKDWGLPLTDFDRVRKTEQTLFDIDSEVEALAIEELHFLPRNAMRWWSIINFVLTNPDTRETFKKDILRKPMYVLPNRLLPSVYIMNLFFQHDMLYRGRRLNILDVCSGLNLSPLLTQPEFCQTEFEGKSLLINDPLETDNLAMVPIVNKCVGVDVQPVNEESLIWAQCCYYPGYENLMRRRQIQKVYDQLKNERHRFPNVVGDVLKQSTFTKALRLFDGRKADVGLLNFGRHQIGVSGAVQKRLDENLSEAIEDDGILIEIGEEMRFNYPGWQVMVKIKDRKNPGRFLPLEPAFYLKPDQETIDYVNPHFFKADLLRTYWSFTR